MIYFCADLHMGHANILEYCKRPFKDVYEMNATIIQNFNSVVKPKDDIYCLGDFAFRDHQQYLKCFNGNFHLIRGNHDGKSCNQANFVWVKDVATVRCPNGEDIFCSHYAHRVWNRSHFGLIHVYGHSHGSLPGLGRSMDVGVDTNNFFPYSYEDIFEKMKDIPCERHFKIDK